jgi:biofilm PGA synthesis N-glycosyltransferase PgaC
MSESSTGISPNRDAGADPLTYLLITPARNEEAHIEETIKSVVGQTIRPVKWVIVSDGSIDRTDEIVRHYVGIHAWMELVRMPERKERHFAGKVHAFNAGLARVAQVPADLIGNLDGDVSFGTDYFEYLLRQFRQNSRLGLAGTNYWEGSLKYDYRFSSIEDVAGACHLFRRQCFEAIGGYRPIKRGSIDSVAVLSARMLGWETRTFTDRYLVHHRPQRTASANKWSRCFHDGQDDYAFGNHVVWEVSRIAYRMTRRPWIIGGSLTVAGFLWAALRRIERPVSEDLIQFKRNEQMRRLRKFAGSVTRPLTFRSNRAGAVEPRIGVMNVLCRIRRKFGMRGIRQLWGTANMKRKLWDREYESGSWTHCEETPGAWVYGFVEKHCRGGSILDLGCGAGNTGNELDANSYGHYTGVDVSEVAVLKATDRSGRNGRAFKNTYVQGDIVSYIPTEKHDVILFRESVYNIPRSRMKATLDGYARHLTRDGVLVVYVSRDGTKNVRELVGWIEANYRIIEKHVREDPAPDAAKYFGDAFVLVFRQT